ncbi:MAG: hypothetical protein BWY57_01677 [Betaproteobacteria bacterium ADurb.Bin341]|nr:MAG: hypothetical protein BWY57_01677 [Betaproteobacteria bacterium ADurb.Bin341]
MAQQKTNEAKKTVRVAKAGATSPVPAKAARKSVPVGGKIRESKAAPSVDVKALKLRGATSRRIKAPPIDLRIEEYQRLQGMLMYSLMALKATVVPFSREIAEIERLVASFNPQQTAEELAERQRSALKFQTLIETFGKELFSSAQFEGEKQLAENELFKLTHIPVKKGVERRASMFHIGGFVPYSDNLFRLLPRANFFDHFIENGIEVYEMKLKTSTTSYNAHLLELSIEKIIDTVRAFSDVAFAHCGQKMILEGYCGTGVNAYTSYLADMGSMAKKFNLILTFVSPLDARKCTLFEQMFQVLNYLNPGATSLDGHIVSSSLDTMQDKNFEKTPMGALVHGWKNKEWANVESMVDLTLRQQSELAAWYWLSLKHGGYYPLSRDLYIFYTRLFIQGVGPDGTLPCEYKGKSLNLNDLKKTGIKVLIFLGGNDHLVNYQTADVLKPMLGDQCQIVVHEKTGHVAYVFNPSRWNKDDGRAFNPGIIETIMNKLQSLSEPAAKVGVASKSATAAKAKVARKPAAPKPAAKVAAAAKPAKAEKPAAKPVVAKKPVAPKPVAKVPAAAKPAKAEKPAAKPAVVAKKPVAAPKPAAKVAAAAKPAKAEKPAAKPAAVAKKPAPALVKKTGVK